MESYLDLTPDRRRLVCEAAGERLGLHAPSVEKDFWICWTLRELFGLEASGRHLTFKGGTSLSKGWGLIQRFSEDVDVAIDREHLGIVGHNAPDEQGLGSKERDRRLDALQQACRVWVRGVLRPEFDGRCSARLKREAGWSVRDDPDDSEGQTILLAYPSVFGAAPYLRPVVKIELGARSDTEPVLWPRIRPFVDVVLPAAQAGTAFTVRTVAPERTFWEKAMLLHEETYRTGSAGPKDRLARHYYDLWCLIRAGVGARAAADDGLFRRVAAHRGVYFRKRREVQDSIARGTLRLLPAPSQLTAWDRDYQAMREAMLFGVVPAFSEVLEVVRDFESTFNATGAGSSAPG